MWMRIAPTAQGAFYVVTGMWPVVHRRSFEAVTGPKKEPWLVQTTGALIAAVGVALLAGARERGRTAKTLGIATALVLGGADLFFALGGRISPVYLGDAVAEAAVIATWLIAD